MACVVTWENEVVKDAVFDRVIKFECEIWPGPLGRLSLGQPGMLKSEPGSCK